METIGLAVGFFLTLCIYSYIFGDNGLYRLAAHILVGVSAAYAAVVAVREVVVPAVLQLLNAPLADPGAASLVVPLLLGALLLLSRLSSRLLKLGNLTLAVLIGIGAAVALIGAVTGTLWPQATAAGEMPLGIITAVLTICALLYFQFTIRTQPEQSPSPSVLRRVLGDTIGRAVIMITFGALFATALITSLSLLTAHLNEMINFVTALMT